MVNKKGFLGMSALALILGLVLLACPTDPEEEKDTWSSVTELAQLDGTWKGSYSETMPLADMMDSSDEEPLATMIAGINVTINAEMTVTINAAAKTQSMSATTTMKFSGGNIATIWSTLKEYMGSDEGVTVNDANHSITMSEVTSEPAAISDEEISKMLAGLRINQNGTKIKVPAGTMDEGSPEVILAKQ
jgi:hypothetical protein